MSEQVNIDFKHNPAQFELVEDEPGDASTGTAGMTEDEADDFLAQLDEGTTVLNRVEG